MRKISLNPLIYEWAIEPLLGKVKGKIARLISKYQLDPVLDLCCGTGRQAHLIAGEHDRIYGLDMDFSMLFHAQKKYPGVYWVRGDAGQIPFKNDAYKGVILSFALHEKTEELRLEILREVQRILSPEGLVIILDYENPWDRRSRIGSVFNWLIERAAGGEHYKNFKQFLSKGALSSFLSEFGLIKVKSYDLKLACGRLVVARFS